MTDTFPPGLVPQEALDLPSTVTRARRTKPAPRRRVTSEPVEPTTTRRRPRTGSGATKSADNIWMHRLANLALIAAVIAGGVGSIDGLLGAAEIAFKPEFHWVLPTALDVFLVGTAVATLALRERRAWPAVVFCIVVSLVLVGFSAVVNFVYWQSAHEPGTLAYEVGPFIKGSMPVLLLIALEILAAINTTKRRTTPASVTRLRAEVVRLKAERRPRARIAKIKAAKAARTREANP